MYRKSFYKNLLSLLPLLALYVILVFTFSSGSVAADESRHLSYATNLTNGYYTDLENPELRNGPGYPLVIALPVLWNTSYSVIRLLNAIFLILAVVLFFKTLSIYLRTTHALALSYLLGLYPPILKWMLFIHSEVFAVFLVCGFLYYFIKLHKQTSNKCLNLFISTSFLGVLALTKVIFGHVIILLGMFYLIIYFLKKSKKVANTLLVLLGGFIVCIPFLFYTYTLTGKILYWGTQGGEILYWRSSPFPNEYGDWISRDIVLENSKTDDFFDISTLSKNHRSFIDSTEPYSYVQRDSLFKEKAIENVKQYPIKYIQNTGSSALRLFFNYPFSYTPQKNSTYFYIIPNMFLVTFLFLSGFLAIRNAAAIPVQIRFIALMSLLFMGGLILLNGRVRHLIPILPLLLFFICFIFKELVTIKINKDLDHNEFK